MTAYDSLTKGLDQALAYAEGQTKGARLHEITITNVNVAAIRRNTGLSQAAFAKSIGVAKGTLLNWEQGRRAPSGPAQVLLALISKNPDVVQELLE